jgi:mono/diheme cytochrome c family protein
MTRPARMLPHRFLCSQLLLSLPLLLAISHTAFAQGTGGHQLGMRLFDQSCRVCHTKPTLLSPQYGPTLSMNTLGGNADVMRAIISNGTSRMPGFKYDFNAAQIDAIVAYIKTIPTPAQTTSAPAKGGASPGAD